MAWLMYRFSSHPVLLFQDEYGNRYTDVSYRKQQTMLENRKELEERCYDISPEQPMLLLERCSAIVKDGMGDNRPPRSPNGPWQGLKLHPLIPGKSFWKALAMTAAAGAKRKERLVFLDYWNQLKPEKLSRKTAGS